MTNKLIKKIKQQQGILRELTMKWVKLKNDPSLNQEFFEKMANDLHIKYTNEHGSINNDGDLLKYYEYATVDLKKRINNLTKKQQ
jgi:hypothetical protein